jgi:hypothetical protein
VLGVALVGGFGRIMEGYLHDSIKALEYFSKHDAQALQYSLIAKSLLSICIEHIQRTELIERLVKGKASSELFGLPVGLRVRPRASTNDTTQTEQLQRRRLEDESNPEPTYSSNAFTTPNWEDFDTGSFGYLTNDSSYDLFGTLNLFPMFDASTEYDRPSAT